MALIKITASELENIHSQILRMSEKASNCANSVASVKNNLDMEVSAKRNIEEQLESIKRDLGKHSEMLKSYANVLDDVVNEFVTTDSNGKTRNVNWGPIAVPGIISGIGIGAIGHTGGMYNNPLNWRITQNLGKIQDAASLFGVKSAETSELSFFDKIWDKGKQAKKTYGLLEKLAQLTNSGNTPKWFEDITLDFGDGLGKRIGYLSDIEKTITAVKEQDVEALGELLGKYGIKKPLKEIVKTTVGGTSAEVGLLVDLIYSDFESAMDISKDIATDFTNVITNPNSNIMDYAKVIADIYRAPDRIITQGFINVVGDTADDIGEVLDTFGIIDAPENGYINFYKDAFSDVKDMYKTFGGGEATSILVDSFRETVSEQFNNTVETLSNIGDKISGFFKDVF